MNKQITFLILFACIVLGAIFMLSFTPSNFEMNFKKIHLYKATSKGAWGQSGKYSSNDSQCKELCTAAQGENCGNDRLVCCQPGICSNDECSKEVYVMGCDF
ncbi:unnamed protein product [Paramecium sonneborni]|uniref:Transmembrane protein n=1 Tax=Paramecium sonneborni TaxID=65129 RepID=A0A8S1N3M1_9CILI|nr:unnamed protein product [Paramecium sonneborni]